MKKKVKEGRRPFAGAFGAIFRRRPPRKGRKGAKLAKGIEGVFVSKHGEILSGTACIQQPLFLSLRPLRLCALCEKNSE
jgi:hypothetical protein